MSLQKNLNKFIDAAAVFFLRLLYPKKEDKNERAEALWRKLREPVVYLFVGGLTTVIDWAATVLFTELVFKGDDLTVTVFGTELSYENTAANVIAFVIAMLAAYWMNKYLVFKNTDAKPLKQFLSFASSRVFTFFLQIASIFVFADVLELNAYAVKAVVSVVVIILNYIFGKTIFKKKEDGEGGEADGKDGEGREDGGNAENREEIAGNDEK